MLLGVMKSFQKSTANKYSVCKL